MRDRIRLLQAQTQAQMRTELDRHDFQDVGKMRDESVAAIAHVGRQPAAVRSATLAILPLGVRSELEGFRLAAPRDERRARWDLTEYGAKVAATLAATLPEPSEDQRADTERRLAALLAEVAEELGPLE